jgi:large subunit ribosomal protein L18
MFKKDERKIRRQKRIRSRISGTKDMPRLTVLRSNLHISTQLINDDVHKSIMGAVEDKKAKGTKTEKAKLLGIDFGKKILAKKIKRIAFDRRGYKYHGRVKALAEGLREAGLQF